MTRILVTGGGGFLGGAIVDGLVSRGEKVSSFSRGTYPTLSRMGVRQIAGDLRSPTDVRHACKGIDAVFHVAAKAGVWGTYREYYEINYLGTRNVIDACRAEGVKRLIHTSSPSVVFTGEDMAGVNESVSYPTRYHAPYPATKALAERAVIAAADHTLSTVTLRPHLIWGPGDNHLVPRILSRAAQLRIVGKGDNLVDTTYIDNAAAAHILAADRLAIDPKLSGKVYFISQGDPIALWEMVNAILKAGGLPPIRNHIPYHVAWTIGFFMEGVHRLFRLKGEPRMTRFVANELASTHWFDIRAAREELGYIPQVSTREGLQRLSNWLGR
ncbi:MAG: NAD-dependent epimerase/dehydratase family protein [Pseudomonadota bacterium]